MADPTYVTELETQVRILGDRVVRLNTENEQLQESNRQSKAQAGISPRLQRERDAAVQQAERLKQELACESKQRADAERLVAALERELAAKESLLERYHAEADLRAAEQGRASARLAARGRPETR